MTVRNRVLGILKSFRQIGSPQEKAEAEAMMRVLDGHPITALRMTQRIVQIVQKIRAAHEQSQAACVGALLSELDKRGGRK